MAHIAIGQGCWIGKDSMRCKRMGLIGGNSGLRRWCRTLDLSGTATTGMLAFPAPKDSEPPWTAIGWSR